jgi:hypothetical protein
VPNGVSDEDDLRGIPQMVKKILINEANLVFHIDAAAMAGSKSQIEFIYTTSQTTNLF